MAVTLSRNVNISARWEEIRASRRRTLDVQFACYVRGSTTTGLTLATGDVARFKTWKSDGDTPALDLDSAAASSNGSSITIDNSTAPARITVRLAQSDVAALAYRNYHGELSYVDDSETAPADAIKPIARGPLAVLDSAGGDVGLT